MLDSKDFKIVSNELEALVRRCSDEQLRTLGIIIWSEEMDRRDENTRAN